MESLFVAKERDRVRLRPGFLAYICISLETSLAEIRPSPNTSQKTMKKVHSPPVHNYVTSRMEQGVDSPKLNIFSFVMRGTNVHYVGSGGHCTTELSIARPFQTDRRCGVAHSEAKNMAAATPPPNRSGLSAVRWPTTNGLRIVTKLLSSVHRRHRYTPGSAKLF